METKSYDYTEDEYQEAFEKVKRDYVGQAKSEKSPRLIFATGQPASGKSALPKKIIKDYPNVSFILIDMDKYRMYHPRLKEIENDNKDKKDEEYERSLIERYAELINQGYDVDSPELIEFYKEIAKD